MIDPKERYAALTKAIGNNESHLYLLNLKTKKLVNYKYNVGKKNFDYSFKEKNINKIIDKKNFIKKYFGRFVCYSVTCDYLYKKLLKSIKKENKFLII